jgi:hypothetical protein
MTRKGASEEEIRLAHFPPCFTSQDEDDTPTKASTTSNRRAGESSRPSKQRRKNDVPEEENRKSDLFFAEILSSQLPIDLATTSKSSQQSVLPGASQNDLSPLLQPSAINQLPSPEMIRILFQIFFDAYPVYAVFQPARLLERLAKGPEHEDYPHPSAIHAILAMAYLERPDVDESIDPAVPANARVGVHYMHTLAAQKSVFDAIHNGDSSGHFFDVARALMLLCIKQYGSGDVLESYMSNSSAIRACISLNLNKEGSSAATNEQQLLQQSLLPRIADTSFMMITPRDAVEAEEIRRAMVVAYSIDRTCIATTLWPGAMAEEDYTASLPRTTLKEFLEGNFGEEIMSRTPRYLNSPSFFTSQAPDAEQLLFKGTSILGKCAEFISRLPRDATKDYIASLPSFQRLENLVTVLQLSTTAQINSLGGGQSNNSVSALSIWLSSDRTSSNVYDGIIAGSATLPYVCTLTLHEPFATLSQESEAVCKGACRSVIAILRVSILPLRCKTPLFF